MSNICFFSGNLSCHFRPFNTRRLLSALGNASTCCFFFINNSFLCTPSTWLDMDLECLCNLYVTTLSELLNQLLPMKTCRYSRRPSNAWFDDECRESKRIVRKIERYVRCSPSPATEVLRQWKYWRQQYRLLLQQKRLLARVR